MNEAQITDLLLTAASDLATALVLPAAMPGRTFEPPATRYLEVTEFRNTTGSPTWGTSAVFQGILQIALHQPNNDEGAITPTEIAGQIAAAFYKNRVLFGDDGRVKINQNPTVLTPIVEGNKTIYPVSIPYIATRGE